MPEDSPKIVIIGGGFGGLFTALDLNGTGQVTLINEEDHFLFRPMLYDLESDPDELIDRGADTSCADVMARLQAALFEWALHPKGHITTSNEKIAAYADNQLQIKGGVLIGIWDEAELAAIRSQISS